MVSGIIALVWHKNIEHMVREILFMMSGGRELTEGKGYNCSTDSKKGPEK
jgi:hypothetical protein